jgi:hypothetical protein
LPLLTIIIRPVFSGVKATHLPYRRKAKMS